MRRVLLIAFDFPPTQSIGVRRMLGFARNLPQYGWEPVVLTVDEPVQLEPGADAQAGVPTALRVVRTPWMHPRLAARRWQRWRESRRGRQGSATATQRMATGNTVANLERGTPPDAATGAPPDAATGTQPTASTSSNTDPYYKSEERSGLARVMDTLLIPDGVIGWLPFAVWRGWQIIRHDGVDAIFSSSRPLTAHCIAVVLKWLTRRPWVADFRDAWSASVLLFHGRGWRYRVHRALEAFLLARADAVIAVSGPQRDLLLDLLPQSAHGKVAVITNGFEPSSWAEVHRIPPACFTVTYTGTLYVGASNPGPFFEALEAVIHDPSVAPGTLRVRFIGSSFTELANAVPPSLLGSVVTLEKPVTHRRAMQAQADASALLLLVSPAQADHGVITGKVFEYLAAHRPILALVPTRSALGDILTPTGAAVFADPTDAEAIRHAILALYHEHRATGDVAWHGRPEVIQAYARPQLTGNLAAILDRVTAERVDRTTRHEPPDRTDRTVGTGTAD